jgi:hypothetical protein
MSDLKSDELNGIYNHYLKVVLSNFEISEAL